MLMFGGNFLMRSCFLIYEKVNFIYLGKIRFYIGEFCILFMFYILED